MAPLDPANPLIVHADRTVVLETFHPRAEEARVAIAPFAELERSPEHLHTYRITPLSLWNAASAGFDGAVIVAALRRFSKFALPQSLEADVAELAGRWGRLRLDTVDGELQLQVAAGDEALLVEVARHDAVAPRLGPARGARAINVALGDRGVLKQALLGVGWPVQDVAGYQEGEALAIDLADGLDVRAYQAEAAEAFFLAGSAAGGSGVVVLPPGSGKTVVGLVAMARVGQRTLILTTSRTSVAQWRRELRAKTSLADDQVAEYGAGRRKGVAPVTLCTYQMLTTRARGADAGDVASYPHLDLMRRHDWGLIVYDEVHLLPAPVFRLTAEIQARRRLGLTATLVREDGREGDVFSLIGPKRYDRPWRELEKDGWIAAADCCEVRLRLPEGERMAYALADPRARYRLAATTEAKDALVRAILDAHEGAPALVIGQYLDQLERLAAALGAPLITGATPQAERERLFDAFRAGDVSRLVLSKVGNFALDLPDAALLVQVSGAFGSRQEEAQRLGRVLRPKAHGAGASFYTLVARETDEESFAHRRQRFLTEQGYAYRIMDGAEWLPVTP
ncbi:MAG: DNA repair helicase XPB [Trueperaceae bacterium]